MANQSKYFIATFLILNGIVLLGQVWPEGAPPFARVINIIVMASDFLYFFILLWHKIKNEKVGKL
ncbi:MAG TPA: hypothetical protein PLN76_07275 [Saprospiraceae bacterium]|nr:hypothetical protein [Saprospiraceae bacterium]